MQPDTYAAISYNLGQPGTPASRLAGRQLADQPAWEQPLSGARAWARSVAQMLRHPGQTLSRRYFPGYAALLAYALPLITIYWSSACLYQSWFNYVSFSVTGLLSLVLAGSVCLWLISLLIHLGLLMVGGARHGWRATFRAMVYLCSGCLLGLVPLLGPLLFLLWWVIALIPALAASHNISKLRVLGGVLVLAALLFFIVMLIAFFVGLSGLVGFLAGGLSGKGL